MSLKDVELFIRRRYMKRQNQPFTGDLVREPRRALALGPGSKILYLQKQGKLGDTLVGIPVIRAVRRSYPGIRSHLLLSRDNSALSAGIGQLVDRVWVFEKTLRSAVRVLQGLRRERYDVTVDFAGGPSASSTLALRWSRPRQAVGFLSAYSGAYTHCVPSLDPGRFHIVERNAQLLLPFGIDPATESLDLEYHITEAEAAAARARLRPTSRPFRLAISVSGANPLKYWGTKNFIAFISWVNHRYPETFEVALSGMPEHASQVAEIAAATGAWDVGPLPSFHDFAAVLREADVLLTPDSAPAHLAAAWKIPAVVLFMQEFQEMPWYPYRSPYRAVLHNRAVASIPVTEVQQAFQSLLAECFPAIGSPGAPLPTE